MRKKEICIKPLASQRKHAIARSCLGPQSVWPKTRTKFHAEGHRLLHDIVQQGELGALFETLLSARLAELVVERLYRRLMMLHGSPRHLAHNLLHCAGPAPPAPVPTDLGWKQMDWLWSKSPSINLSTST